MPRKDKPHWRAPRAFLLLGAAVIGAVCLGRPGLFFGASLGFVVALTKGY
jgi:hypothetical protein